MPRAYPLGICDAHGRSCPARRRLGGTSVSRPTRRRCCEPVRASGSLVSIDRPIFIVGPHRSGTTLLYEVLGRHPDLGYFNRQDKRFPGAPRLAAWLTRLTAEDQPMETQPVWDRFKRGGGDTMTAEHADPRVSAWFRRRVATTLRLRGAPRFLAKYPRLSLRLEWLDAIFPDALFIHVQRDWRAVVNSTVNRQTKRHRRGGGWFGVHIPGWEEMGELPLEVVATRQFVAVTETLDAAADRFGGRLIRLSYEALCREPLHTLRDLLSAVGLPWLASFEASVPTDLRSANFKWREQLGEERAAQLREEAPALLSQCEDPTEV